MKKSLLLIVLSSVMIGCASIEKEIHNGMQTGITAILGVDKNGFNKEGIHIGTKTNYNQYGYDKYGYNKFGFNSRRIHRDTQTEYDLEGFNAYGKTIDGYDRNGLNKDGWDRDGYNKDGLNKYGFNRDKWHPKLEVFSNGKTKEGKIYEVTYKIKAGSGLNDIDGAAATMLFLMSGGAMNMHNSPITSNGQMSWAIEELYVDGKNIQPDQNGFFKVKLPIGTLKNVKYIITSRNNNTGRLQQYYKNGTVGYRNIEQLLNSSPSVNKYETLYLLPI